jgi:sulfur-carrier protein
MEVVLQLFGVYRRFQDVDSIVLTCPDGATIADVKAALCTHAAQHWPDWKDGILRSTAFASSEAILRNGDPVPGDGRVAVLPPVSGG